MIVSKMSMALSIKISIRLDVIGRPDILMRASKVLHCTVEGRPYKMNVAVIVAKKLMIDAEKLDTKSAMT